MTSAAVALLPAAPSQVMVVDDEGGILTSLQKILEREGYHVAVAACAETALTLLQQQPAHVVLADVMLPNMSGMQLLQALKDLAPSTELIMMTAFGTLEMAVECMRQGAYDFIAKPLKRAIVVRSVQRALEHQRLLHENTVLRAAMHGATQNAVIGQSAALRRTLEVVAQAAPSAATILLVGESGTGKELLARTVHARSASPQGPYVTVNCAALPETLLESELFGHEKGAFTGAVGRRAGRFERAHGGTLFLDEIGETSPALQLRLLRVLQEGEIERVGGQQVTRVDVRVVAATHRHLADDVRRGRFRADLFYRLNVIQIAVPPLRARQGDVGLLVQHFLQRYCQKNHKKIQGCSAATLQALEAYSWPGNVRELENTLERAVVLCRGERLELHDLPEALRGVCTVDSQPTNPAAHPSNGIFLPFGLSLEEVKQRFMRATLARHHGDKQTTARLLGIAARTIYRKNITPEA